MAEELTLYMHTGVRGLAEKIRILLAETGLRCADVGLDKASFEQLCKDKVLNFDTLPVLKHGNQYIEDSAAILEYIAELADKQGKGQAGNLYCGKPEDRVFVRAIANAATEFSKQAKPWLGKDKADANLLSEVVPKWFGHFQRVLDKNDDGDVRTEEWTFGKCFTFADVTVFEAINAVVQVHNSTCLRAFPKLKEFHDKVAGRARIDRFLSSRPSQVFLA